MNEKLCRLCFAEKLKRISIFGGNSVQQNIVEIIREHFSDEITENDHLPKSICRDCWTELENFHKFYIAVNEAKHEFLLQFVKHEEPNFVEINCDSFGADDDICQMKLEPEIDHDEIPLPLVEVDDDRNHFGQEDEFSQLECIEAADSGVRPIESFEGGGSSNDANDTGDDLGSTEDVLDDSAVRLMEREIIKNKENSSNEMIRNQKNSEIEQFDHMLSNYLDTQCEICKHPFGTLREATRHYQSIHKQRAITVKCCQRRVKIYGEYLRDHIRYHLNPEAFQCAECGKTNASRYHLNEHLKLHSEVRKQSECNICKKKMSSSNLQRHFLNVHSSEQQECSICHKHYANKRSLVMHVNTVHKRRYHRTCPICSKEFNVKRELLRHLEKHNAENSSIPKTNVHEHIDRLIANYMDMQCEVCQHPFETLTEACRHYQSEHQRGNILVKCCQRRLKMPGEIRDHIQFHLDPDKFKCGECGRTYLSRYKLNFHLREHLKRNFKEKFECDICKLKMLSKNAIRSHILRDHLKQDGEHECEICKKRFLTMAGYRQHVKYVHEQRLQQRICHICTKTCKTNYQMNMHLLEHSAIKDPPVSCEYCGKSFKRKQLLKIHVQTQHVLDGKVYECPHCQKQFPKKHLMRDHVIYHHKVKLHKCNICDKGFRKPRLLREHMAVHTGVDLYQCEYCPKTFKAPGAKLTHCRRMHPDEWRIAKEAK